MVQSFWVVTTPRPATPHAPTRKTLLVAEKLGEETDLDMVDLTDHQVSVGAAGPERARVDSLV